MEEEDEPEGPVAQMHVLKKHCISQYICFLLAEAVADSISKLQNTVHGVFP